MSEILFRGKTEQGEWLYGYLVKGNYNTGFGIIEDHIDKGLRYVKEETVGQFTGLTDKNGKKIFEGDICGCFCNTQQFAIKYCEERCGYFFDDCVSSGYSYPAPECLGNLRNTIEVIGNIHDNPELLEAE